MTDKEKLNEIRKIVYDMDTTSALSIGVIYEGSNQIALSDRAIIDYARDAVDDIREILLDWCS